MSNNNNDDEDTTNPLASRDAVTAETLGGGAAFQTIGANFGSTGLLVTGGLVAGTAATVWGVRTFAPGLAKRLGLRKPGTPRPAASRAARGLRAHANRANAARSNRHPGAAHRRAGNNERRRTRTPGGIAGGPNRKRSALANALSRDRRRNNSGTGPNKSRHPNKGRDRNGIRNTGRTGGRNTGRNTGRSTGRAGGRSGGRAGGRNGGRGRSWFSGNNTGRSRSGGRRPSGWTNAGRPNSRRRPRYRRTDFVCIRKPAPYRIRIPVPTIKVTTGKIHSLPQGARLKLAAAPRVKWKTVTRHRRVPPTVTYRIPTTARLLLPPPTPRVLPPPPPPPRPRPPRFGVRPTIRVDSVRVDRPYPTQKGVKLLSAQPEVAASGNDITVSNLVAPGIYFQQAIEALQGYVPPIPDRDGAAPAFRDALGDFAVLVAAVANAGRLLAEVGIERVWMEASVQDVLLNLPSQIAYGSAAAAEVQQALTQVHEEQFEAIESGDPRKAAWNVK